MKTIRTIYLQDAVSIIDNEDITSIIVHGKVYDKVKFGKLLSTDAYPHKLYCSECFKTLIRNEEICFEKNEFPKYCMWCGARMEAENDSAEEC